MTTYFRLNADSINIRSGPSSGFSDIGDLFRGDVVAVEERSGNWSRIVDARHPDGSPVLLSGGRGPLSSYSGQCWATNAYFVQVSALPGTPPPDPDPDPPPEPEEYILHVKDGVTRKFLPE